MLLGRLVPLGLWASPKMVGWFFLKMYLFSLAIEFVSTCAQKRKEKLDGTVGGEIQWPFNVRSVHVSPLYIG